MAWGATDCSLPEAWTDGRVGWEGRNVGKLEEKPGAIESTYRGRDPPVQIAGGVLKPDGQKCYKIFVCEWDTLLLLSVLKVMNIKRLKNIKLLKLYQFHKDITVFIYEPTIFRSVEEFNFTTQLYSIKIEQTMVSLYVNLVTRLFVR